jgi:hypothetical protein
MPTLTPAAPTPRGAAVRANHHHRPPLVRAHGRSGQQQPQAFTPMTRECRRDADLEIETPCPRKAESIGGQGDAQTDQSRSEATRA